ncbi:MAG: thiol:disulfide interchange protein DsbD [Lysobacteraceae bacterium]|nr:MAG: thiol:disulfide interchange protein DsbD [Xanthomonadaceae bacterium]
MKIPTIAVSLGLLLTSSLASAVDPSQLLPVDEAFAIRAEAVDANTVRIHWDIADGYYMYRGRMGFDSATEGVELGEAISPPGKVKDDEFFGVVETYRDGVDVDLPLIYGLAPATVTIEARSQGCADLGVCYPPNTQTVTVDLPAADNPSAAASPLSLGAAPGLNLFGDEALPEDEAFRFEAIDGAPDQILVRFTIADGYYMYRDKFAFALSGDEQLSLAALQLPPGEPMYDEHFGDVQVFRGLLEFELKVYRQHLKQGSVELQAGYQGCKEAGICYPPMQRTVPIVLPAGGPLTKPPEMRAAAPEPIQVPVSEQDRLASALAGDNVLWTVLGFFGFGLLLTFTPCVFPMIPILSGIIAGQGKKVTTGRAFALSLVYVLAMALTYTVVGVIAGLFGHNLQAAFQNAWILAGFSAIFVALALSMFGFYELQLPASWQSRLNEWSGKQGGGTWLGAAIMGLLSALIVGPCVAPPLMGALIYIGQTGDAVLGGLALFALSMGMGVPLLLFGTSAGKWLPQAGAWMDAVKAVFGVALLAVAIWLLERILAPQLIMVLWGCLALAVAVYLRAFDGLPDGASGWRRLWKALGLILALFGAMQLLGAAAGGKDWQQPLKGIGLSSGSAASVDVRAFEYVSNNDELDEALARAASRNQPTLLDFYADWCVDCKRMDKYTFPEAVVQDALQGAVLLKIDVTENNESDQMVLRRFGLIGPPATLFFDRSAQERRAYRLVGYQQPDAFAAHVKQAFQP